MKVARTIPLILLLALGAFAAAMALVPTLDFPEGLSGESLVSAALVVLAVCVAFFLGWFFARRPRGEMVERARSILEKAAQPGKSIRLQRGKVAELGRALDVLSGEIAEATRRLEAERNERLATLEQLRHADRLKTVGQLTSGILHELGTPLTIVSGRCKMISDGEMEGEEARESARIAVEQTERITKMVRGILDFARRGRRSESVSDLGDLARTTLKLMGPMALKRGVSLRWGGDDSPARVTFDASQIQQVIANLVLNAIQASEGGQSVEVSLDCVEKASPDSRSDRFWALRIVDHGVGIPSDVMEHLFESFYTTKQEGEGTGLGLTISQQIMVDHGGWLEVESEPGSGSVFSVFLPVEEDR